MVIKDMFIKNQWKLIFLKISLEMNAKFYTTISNTDISCCF